MSEIPEIPECNHVLDALVAAPGPPYSLYCVDCNKPVSEGVFQMIADMLLKLQDKIQSLEQENTNLQQEIEDVRKELKEEISDVASRVSRVARGSRD